MRPPSHGADIDGDHPVITLLAFPISEAGGIAAFARRLLAALETEQGRAFPLLAPTSPKDGQTTRWGQVRFAAKALRALVRARPRAIQTHENLPLLGAALLCKLCLLGSPRVIHTIHVDPAGRRSWLRRA